MKKKNAKQSSHHDQPDRLEGRTRSGAITLPTLTRLLELIRTKTTYSHHVAVEVVTGVLLKTIDNEEDALETIWRLEHKP